MIEQLALPLPGLAPAAAAKREARLHPARTVTLVRSTHPAAIAGQDRRRIAALRAKTAEANEATRRREHRLALEAAMEAARIEQGEG